MHIIDGRRLCLKLGAILAALLMLGLVAPRRAEAATMTSAERQMIRWLNEARHVKGRASLAPNDVLANYARRHSPTMASKNKLYHNPYLAQWLAKLDWRILGENVGVGPNTHDLHVAFWNSPPHRANMLDRRFRDVGIGIVTRNGRVWVTVIFRG
jgi:uncharacterized protein YkwD